MSESIGEKINKIIEYASALQKGLCAYGTIEGDGKKCDCKFGIEPFNSRMVEENGCCEARKIIWLAKELSSFESDIRKDEREKFATELSLLQRKDVINGRPVGSP